MALEWTSDNSKVHTGQFYAWRDVSALPVSTPERTRASATKSRRKQFQIRDGDVCPVEAQVDLPSFELINYYSWCTARRQTASPEATGRNRDDDRVARAETGWWIHRCHIC